MTNHDGGVHSLADLYLQFHLPIFRYLCRLTGSSLIAEELAQETFYQAILSAHRFEGRAKVSTWLYKIARHVYLRDKKMQTRDDKLEKKLTYEQANNTYGNPEEELHEKILESQIQDALAKLPEQYRTIIILKEVEQLSHNDIAAVMGKTVSSTRVLLYRAKQRFQEEYRGEVRL
jgi:RNA polymerase sigma-70 factor (ECF subfamily)